MSPPSAAHDIVGRMPPTIIVPTSIGKRRELQEPVHREGDEQRAERTPGDDLRRADAARPRAEERDRDELQQAADRGRDEQVLEAEPERPTP